MLAKRDSKKIQTASDGHGPLWQRDYWVEMKTSALSPEAIVMMIRKEFPAFSPDEMARFTRLDGANGPLEIGDEMQVEIRGAGTCEVRVVGIAPRVLTLRTLDGHMEAGRISFGAYLENGAAIFRIRSRARSSSRRRHIAYVFAGKALQQQVWQTFVKRVALRCGLEDADVRTQTRQVRSTLADTGELDTATFPTDR